MARIHGLPGHLIVEAWPGADREDDHNAFGNHGNPAHFLDAQVLYEFFSNHVSFEATIRHLYYRLQDEYPWWDEERREWERDHGVGEESDEPEEP